MAIIAGGAGLNALLRRQGEPPTAAWVREQLWGDNLLAYEVRQGVPRAVVRMGNRVQYDLLIPGDWFWPNWPPAPQWQLAGIGYSIAASNAAATVGFAPCVGVYGERCGRTIELFGQVNAPEIVAMEVLGEGEWRSFPAAAPGYAVRVEGLTSAPSGYRWLDAEGRVVRELEDVSPTNPGASPAGRAERYRRRRRRQGTSSPVSSPSRSGDRRALGQPAMP